jgi:hypothetical protein
LVAACLPVWCTYNYYEHALDNWFDASEEDDQKEREREREREKERGNEKEGRQL